MRSTVAVSIPLLCVLCGMTQALDPAKYSRAIPMGLDFLRNSTICLSVGATAQSGDFFQDLTRRKGPSGIRFWKHEQEIRVYPPTITVTILAALDSCVRPGDPDAPEYKRDLVLDENAMRDATVAAYWKQGLTMRAADAGLRSVAQEPPSVWIESVRPSATWWKYEVVVQSKDVPIGDSLVLDLSSKDGTRLGRFVLRL